MSQRVLASNEIRLLQKALEASVETGNLRLREGEHQYILAKAIASFQLENTFPDVKDIVRRLYGEEKTNDVPLIRKTQTILKKMEKSNIVRILPKKKPWELQKYALSSFKFQDSDKRLVILATDEEIRQAKDLLSSLMSRQEHRRVMPARFVLRACLLMLSIGVSYVAIMWAFLQPIANPIIFISALSIAIVCSIVLGRTLSER